MTSEVLIMNQEGIALAADSATTASAMYSSNGRNAPSPKIFESTDKIVPLPKCHHIAFMTSGSADWMGLPWETIVKLYGYQLGSKVIADVQGYADDFLTFLSKLMQKIPEEAQNAYFETMVESYFRFVRDFALSEMDSEKFDKSRITKVVSKSIKEREGKWRKAEFSTGMGEDQLEEVKKRFEMVIWDAYRSTFGDLSLSKDDSRRLAYIAACLCVKNSNQLWVPKLSDVIIAGYGSQDIFPSYVCLEISAPVIGRLRYCQTEEGSIDFERRSIISPFCYAIDDARCFLGGVHPEYLDAMEFIMKETLSKFVASAEKILLDSMKISEFKSIGKELRKEGKEILKTGIEELTSYEIAHFFSPVNDNIAILPKEEMAKFAEFLVSLSSMRQRYSTSDVSVSGPIDVAVITKADGVVWYRRKCRMEPLVDARRADYPAESNGIDESVTGIKPSPIDQTSVLGFNAQGARRSR